MEQRTKVPSGTYVFINLNTGTFSSIAELCAFKYSPEYRYVVLSLRMITSLLEMSPPSPGKTSCYKNRCCITKQKEFRCCYGDTCCTDNFQRRRITRTHPPIPRRPYYAGVLSFAIGRIWDPALCVVPTRKTKTHNRADESDDPPSDDSCSQSVCGSLLSRSASWPSIQMVSLRGGATCSAALFYRITGSAHPKDVDRTLI